MAEGGVPLSPRGLQNSRDDDCACITTAHSCCCCCRHIRCLFERVGVGVGVGATDDKQMRCKLVAVISVREFLSTRWRRCGRALEEPCTDHMPASAEES